MRSTIWILLSLVIFSCKDEITYYEDDGIWIEDLSEIEIDTTLNKYNYDNKIYKPNIEYIYDYYQIRDGKKVKFSSGGWEYIEYDNPNNSTIIEYGIQTMKDNGFMRAPEDYTQSIIQFNMYDIDGEQTFGSSQTGVIENSKNVWIHPIRHNNFKILELNPFPFIKSPYKIGNKYSWTLGIGDQWADPNWKVWSGSIENQINYEITDKQKIMTKAGEFEVYVINSEANSRLGTTGLKSYFNENVGFVKHEYVNIDSTELVIELKAIKEIK